MANKDASFGLKLIGHIKGAPYTARVRKYYVASGTAALFVGDPVVDSGASNTAVVTISTESHGIGTLPAVVKATAGDGNKVVGVIVGFEQAVRSSSAPQGATGVERVALVCDDPDALFLIQADGSVATTDISANANLIYTNPGSTGSGLSGAELDTSSMTTTATFQLKILGNADIPGRNEMGSANPVLIVKINNHRYGNVVAGL